jgi:tripartite-type tricarboxylate transporter receptor subunit TctC
MPDSMKILRLIALGCAALANVPGGHAIAQAFPVRPIRLVTSEPGGAGDLISRLMVPIISPALGQQAVVDNRPGVIVAGQAVARAVPDGHTLIVYGGTLWLGPYLRQSPYDPVADFAPVTLASSSPCVLVVHPSVQANSVRELVDLARAKPGVLNYGSGNAGSISHLAPELFKSMAGINIARVPYKGAGPALNALIAGEVQVMIATAPSASPHIKSGRMRALAVTSAKPSVLFPGMVTVADAGVPAYEAVAYIGIFATGRSPRTAIARLNAEMVRALGQPDVREKLLSVGVETIGSTPEALRVTVKEEMARMGKVIREAGIREQ